ncbi:MAG: hypothetical protein LLG00_06875 [Planctomycetaceae bacterium]|nr:hypothetical protein [Planctomycetaceae bacterium]
MKRERRHELQHNALADWLAKAVEDIKPYKNGLIAALLVVVCALAAYGIISQLSAAKNAMAWDGLNQSLDSGNPSSFTRVMDEYPNTSVANMAAVVAADMRLGEGCNRLFQDKAVAIQQLRQAAELYARVLDQSSDPSLLERATFGLARAWEAQGAETDLEAATRRYNEVVKNWPDGAFASAARDRLNDLKRPTIKRLYDDLTRYSPKPVAPRESEAPGEMPRFAPEGLPSNPPAGGNDINFEEIGGKGSTKAQEKAKSSEPAKGKVSQPSKTKDAGKKK